MDKLENIFKKSLENAEAPYDSKAWDAMSSRLDKVMPTSSVKPSFKWAWVAGVVLIAGTSALVLFYQDSKIKEDKTLQVSKIEQEISDKEKSKEIISNEENQENVISSTETTSSSKITKISANSPDRSNEISVAKTENTLPNTVKNSSSNETKAGDLTSSNNVAEVSENKEVKSVPFEENPVKEAVITKVDFTVSNETFYEKGLPFNSLTCNVEAKQYLWTNEKGEVLSADKNADIHLFTAGLHPITLTIVNLDGKKQSITKPVRCEVNYNLLAVTGFNPASSDYRNNTFLPFALLKSERNIPFEMQIMDAKTGQVIFETKSADLPWDGMDMRTNQLVPVNSTYIWRVNIQEKAVGEPTNRYQGTITRI